MKYKVGDKVKVRSDLKCEEYYGGITFNFEMNKFKGMEITIARVNYGGYYEVLETPYNFTDEMLEPVEEMSAEEAIRIQAEMCRSTMCKDCAIDKLRYDSHYECSEFRSKNPDKVIEILKQWKKDHEKKEVETEFVYLIRVMEEEDDSSTCIYTYEVKEDKDDIDEKMDELVEQYYEENGGKIYAKLERICRVKS